MASVTVNGRPTAWRPSRTPSRTRASRSPATRHRRPYQSHGLAARSAAARTPTARGSEDAGDDDLVGATGQWLRNGRTTARAVDWTSPVASRAWTRLTSGRSSTTVSPRSSGPGSTCPHARRSARSRFRRRGLALGRDTSTRWRRSTTGACATRPWTQRRAARAAQRRPVLDARAGRHRECRVHVAVGQLPARGDRAT